MDEVTQAEATAAARRPVTRTAVFAFLVAVEIVVIATLYLTLPSAVPRDIAGTVRCLSGKPVVDVWVEGFSGGSWFAELSWPSTDGSVVSYVYRLPSGGQYEVRVGCGGTRGDWFTTNYSGYVDYDHHDFVCDDPPVKGVDGRCR